MIGYGDPFRRAAAVCDLLRPKSVIASNPPSRMRTGSMGMMVSFSCTGIVIGKRGPSPRRSLLCAA